MKQTGTCMSTVHFVIAFLSLHVTIAAAFIHPIEVKGNHFVDAITNEPFFIKGVDYQPGGSSEVSEKQDPLSDPNTCARDIILFQELGINTIRIYSINPALNHDTCMTMLASAGIYLILDVNSPLQNQHLNRYEPWTTYNPHYLEHVFKIIEQFGYYNNTLGFFAGNEIINDKKSAQHSPPYVKRLINDMKLYIKGHSPRTIPVGYSAADDLKYRVPLSKYLECLDPNYPEASVDFYGVNSYQWCGGQTFESSGYDALVEAYKNFTKPVFFSEFGCNEVLPRTFDEVSTIYSKDMHMVFSGGLVYEFTQGANNYGLIEVDTEGNAHLLNDFDSLRTQYASVSLPTLQQISRNVISDPILNRRTSSLHIPVCDHEYENIEITAKVPNTLASDFLKRGVRVTHGKYVNLADKDLMTSYKIYDKNGKPYKERTKVEVVQNINPLSDSNGQNVNKVQNLAASTFSNVNIPFLLTCVFSYLLLETGFQVAIASF